MPRYGYTPAHGYICGCYYLLPAPSKWSPPPKQYLAQVSTKAHTTILATTSRTALTQTFTNPSPKKAIRELSYSFPLYDGVSVVGFKCHVGDRVIVGEVKEKEKARAVYEEAKSRGEVAGLMEQLPDASDVFITKLGNVPPGVDAVVEITYLGELKHDAEVDGIRFTIPTFVAPRYGEYPSALSASATKASEGFEVTVDAELGEGAYIREMRSPSHPIAVSLGTTSLAKHDDPTPNKASATLSLGTAELDKDFVLQIVAKETAIPKAMLETHPTIPGQRALMATLVPKFALPAERPEIVFVCDRSGSMYGSNIAALRNALKVFLKSLPVGAKFNICSFGSSHSFLWKKSESYSQSSLDKAMKYVEGFDADMGGTEMYAPMEESIKRRYKDMNLEIFLVTDGEIWDQDRLFELLNEEITAKGAPIRVFTLGIGDAFSSSLIEGVARAGNGFSQAVGENEKLDGKVVRMLKAALSPHINDYTLEVKYADGSVDKAVNTLSIKLENSGTGSSPSDKKPTISLFDASADPDATTTPASAKDDKTGEGRYSHLPKIDPPTLLQAPHKIPPLFAFSRSTVYLLVSPLASQTTPLAVVLRATSRHGPLELEIPVQVLSQPGETIHQLAAKKAVHELEQGRGWLYSATDVASGKLLKDANEGRFKEFVEREAVRLGVDFQVGGKWCSFVAVEKKGENKDKMEEDWEFLDDESEIVKGWDSEVSYEKERASRGFGSPAGYVLHPLSSKMNNSIPTKGTKGDRDMSNEEVKGTSKTQQRQSVRGKGSPARSITAIDHGIAVTSANARRRGPPPPPSAPGRGGSSTSIRARKAAPMAMGTAAAPSKAASDPTKIHYGSARSTSGSSSGVTGSLANSLAGAMLSRKSAKVPSSHVGEARSATVIPQATMDAYKAEMDSAMAMPMPDENSSEAEEDDDADGDYSPPATRSRRSLAATSSSPAPSTLNKYQTAFVEQALIRGEKLDEDAMDKSSLASSTFSTASYKKSKAMKSGRGGLLSSISKGFGFGSAASPPPPPPAPAPAPAAAARSPPAPAARGSLRSVPSAQKAPARPALEILVDLQTFEGYWAFTAELCSAVGVDMAAVKKAGAGVDEKVLATVLAIVFLERQLRDEEEAWELMVEKARGWLEGEGVGEGDQIWAKIGKIIG